MGTSWISSLYFIVFELSTVSPGKIIFCQERPFSNSWQNIFFAKRDCLKIPDKIFFLPRDCFQIRGKKIFAKRDCLKIRGKIFFLWDCTDSNLGADPTCTLRRKLRLAGPDHQPLRYAWRDELWLVLHNQIGYPWVGPPPEFCGYRWGLNYASCGPPSFT